MLRFLLLLWKWAARSCSGAVSVSMMLWWEDREGMGCGISSEWGGCHHVQLKADVCFLSNGGVWWTWLPERWDVGGLGSASGEWEVTLRLEWAAHAFGRWPSTSCICTLSILMPDTWVRLAGCASSVRLDAICATFIYQNYSVVLFGYYLQGNWWKAGGFWCSAACLSPASDVQFFEHTAFGQACKEISLAAAYCVPLQLSAEIITHILITAGWFEVCLEYCDSDQTGVSNWRLGSWAAVCLEILSSRSGCFSIPESFFKQVKIQRKFKGRKGTVTCVSSSIVQMG